MDRRAFAGATCCTFCGAGAGCLDADESEPNATIAFVELENHRREAGYEFSVRIEGQDGTRIDESNRLGPAGSGTGAMVLEEPVTEPGTYSVRVDVGDHSATVETGDLISADETCLGLRFYLGARTLHVEHRSFTRCE